jgi:pyruvate/2-oxoglutarate dehydrogenase complex dihydrolipoamide acyltransferase (E2) component
MRLVAVVLPDLGTSAELPIVVSHWYASRGESVLEGDRLVELLVGPATYDVSSPAAGRLHEVCRFEDDRVYPGLVLGYVAEDAGDPPGREPP